MKKFLSLGVALACAAFSQASFILDFEELTVSDIVTDQYTTTGTYGTTLSATETNYIGVSFSNTTASEDVITTTIAGAAGLSGNVLGVSNVGSQTKVRADFESAGVLGVKVNIGDNNADEENVFLEAYDSLDQLISSDTANIPAASSSAPQLSVSSGSPNIAYVLMWGEGGFGGANTFSVGIDNMEVESVPEPMTMTLLGAGAFAMLRRRKKKA